MHQQTKSGQLPGGSARALENLPLGAAQTILFGKVVDRGFECFGIELAGIERERGTVLSDGGQLVVIDVDGHHLGAKGMCDLLSLIHISEPTRRTPISYAVFCLKK